MNPNVSSNINRETEAQFSFNSNPMVLYAWAILLNERWVQRCDKLLFIRSALIGIGFLLVYSLSFSPKKNPQDRHNKIYDLWFLVVGGQEF